MKRYLVPCDFSKASELALDTAGQWVEAHGGHVYVVHVLSLVAMQITDNPLIPNHNLQETERVLEEECLSALGEFIEKSRLKKKQVTPAVLKGAVWQQVRDFGVEEKIDLMIIGETGNTLALGDRLMSTLTDRIIHKSRIPVLVVKSKIELEKVNKLVLADDMGDADMTIQKVKATRKLLDAKIEVVRINTPYQFMSDVYFDYKLKELKKADLSDCSFHRFNHDSLVDGLIYFATRRKADLMVVAGKQRSMVRRWFLIEDLAEQVMDFADLPVLIMD